SSAGCTSVGSPPSTTSTRWSPGPRPRRTSWPGCAGPGRRSSRRDDDRSGGLPPPDPRRLPDRLGQVVRNGQPAGPSGRAGLSRRRKMRTRKFAAVAAGLTLALTLAACGGEGAGSGNDDETPGGDTGTSEEGGGEGGTIGVAMPTQTSERWIADGNAVKEQLEEKGYTVDLQYANDDIPTQTQQIDQMITQGVDLLIIASIDGTALTSQLEAAGAA